MLGEEEGGARGGGCGLGIVLARRGLFRSCGDLSWYRHDGDPIPPPPPESGASLCLLLGGCWVAEGVSVGLGDGA